MMKNKGIYYLFSFLLLAGLIAVGVGVAYNITNGFQSGLTSFVVVNSEGKLVINGSNEYVDFREVNKFKINGLNNNQFNVNIYGNSNFKYFVNKTETSFSDVKQSLNSFFEVEVLEYEFTLKPNYLASEIVKSLYTENEVTFDDTLNKNGAYFTCEVSTDTEYYRFNLIYNLVTEITFDSSGVIFE